jgi:hypothetical protein
LIDDREDVPNQFACFAHDSRHDHEQQHSDDNRICNAE